MLDIEVFEKKYTMYTEFQSEVFTDDESTDGMFETYGKDLEIVLKVANTYPRRVWTAYDGDEGFYLSNGYHLVDRVYYIITNEDGTEDEHYLITNYNQNGEVCELSDIEMSNVKKRLYELEKQEMYATGYARISGGFCLTEIINVDNDVITVELRSGIQNDCQNDVYTVEILLDRKTLEEITEE